MRTLLIGTVACLAAVSVVSVAFAGRSYLPMAKPALVARSYQHYLNTDGFKERCQALDWYVVACRGTTLTNDPTHPRHTWRTQIRKLSRTTAERRIWMDGKSLGKPVVDRSFVRYFHIRGWN
jgi:hypothetical protein